MTRVQLLATAGMTLLAGGLRAQAVPAGVSYASRITVDSGNGRPVTMSIRFRMSGNRVRTENSMSGPIGEAVAGTYSIIDRGDSTMTMVMPKQRMAMVTNLRAMFPAGAQTLRMGATHIKTSRTEALGAGEPIDGFETQHMRVTSSGTNDFSVGDQMCSKPFNTVMEMWVAPALDLKGAALALQDALGSAGLPRMTDARPDDSAAPGAGGAPLRMLMRATERDAKGHELTVTTTMEITELRQEAIDDAEFAVPAGYRRMKMDGMLGGMATGVMSGAVRDVNEKLLKTMCGTG
jgi:hypothetical protein